MLYHIPAKNKYHLYLQHHVGYEKFPYVELCKRSNSLVTNLQIVYKNRYIYIKYSQQPENEFYYVCNKSIFNIQYFPFYVLYLDHVVCVLCCTSSTLVFFNNIYYQAFLRHGKALDIYQARYTSNRKSIIKLSIHN